MQHLSVNADSLFTIACQLMLPFLSHFIVFLTDAAALADFSFSGPLHLNMSQNQDES